MKNTMLKNGRYFWLPAAPVRSSPFLFGPFPTIPLLPIHFCSVHRRPTYPLPGDPATPFHSRPRQFEPFLSCPSDPEPSRGLRCTTKRSAALLPLPFGAIPARRQRSLELHSCRYHPGRCNPRPSYPVLPIHFTRLRSEPVRAETFQSCRCSALPSDTLLVIAVLPVASSPVRSYPLRYPALVSTPFLPLHCGRFQTRPKHSIAFRSCPSIAIASRSFLNSPRSSNPFLPLLLQCHPATRD